MITGITGQDGRFLAELLHSKGYTIYGLIKGQNNPKTELIRREHPYVELIGGDLCDLSSLIAALVETEPDEVYNLAAISFVPMSFNQSELTANVNGTGVLRMLEAIRIVGGRHNNPTRFYQASSSEMFGSAPPPQGEDTPFHPRSPYAVAKLYAYWITVNYREAYGMYACNGILFNHESERRGVEFVTRKVSKAVARIKLGLQYELVLGDLEPRRDWGYAGDYVKAMWQMLQLDEPDDYVVATGQSYAVRDLVQLAFEAIDIDDWERFVRQDPKFLRPAEVDLLVGDATKAHSELGWSPDVQFSDLVRRMVTHDLAIERGAPSLR